nr:hypothetical protein BaRGS_021761 [Batillaria attramentaria]
MYDEDVGASPGPFLYFGYASNMLKERLTSNKLNVVFKCVAKLEGYELQFCGEGKGWHGAMASIQEKPGSHIWGVVWQLNQADQERLNRQESTFTPKEVDVTSTDNQVYRCRVYTQELRATGKPSPHYKDIILRGARQNNLPEGYIKCLESVEDNGYAGEIDIYKQIMEEVNKQPWTQQWEVYSQVANKI